MPNKHVTIRPLNEPSQSLFAPYLIHSAQDFLFAYMACMTPFVSSRKNLETQLKFI